MVKEEDDVRLEFDHGCQFLRADTDRMKDFLSKFVKAGVVQEWKGKFVSGGKRETRSATFWHAS